MAHGAFLERTDLEMARVIDNILDPNTDAKTKRKLTVTFEFSTDDDRENITTKCTVKSSLAPLKPSTTFLYVADSENIVEMAPQIQGQRDIYGGEQEAPANLKIIKIS